MIVVATPEANLTAAIQAAIQHAADTLREEAIKAAVTQYETDLRAAVLRASVAVADHYEMSRDGQTVTIRVRYG